MKFRTAILVSLLMVAATVVSAQRFSGKTESSQATTGDKADRKDRNKNESQGSDDSVERRIATDANVAVKVCVVSGSIKVRGWDRNEVRARSNDVAEMEFRHVGEPAKKVELLVADKAEGPGRTSSCLSFSDVELDVPRGATVQLQTRDGDIEAVDVATAYVNTQNGDVTIEHAAKAVDAGTIGGSITLKGSSGCINLHSTGGNIEAIDIRPSEASDIFDATSVGGDISLRGVTHAKLNARTLNGSLSMTGPLAHDGHYGFRTISGDVTLNLPANSSFKLSARLSRSAELITDFPITLTSYSTAPASPTKSTSASTATAPVAVAQAAPVVVIETDQDSTKDKSDKTVAKSEKAVTKSEKVVTRVSVQKPQVVIGGPSLRRIDGVCGNGDATIEVASFSGTIQLKKK